MSSNYFHKRSWYDHYMGKWRYDSDSDEYDGWHSKKYVEEDEREEKERDLEDEIIPVDECRAEQVVVEEYLQQNPFMPGWYDDLTPHPFDYTFFQNSDPPPLGVFDAYFHWNDNIPGSQDRCYKSKNEFYLTGDEAKWTLKTNWYPGGWGAPTPNETADYPSLGQVVIT